MQQRSCRGGERRCGWCRLGMNSQPGNYISEQQPHTDGCPRKAASPPRPPPQLKARGCAPPLLQSCAATPQPSHSVSFSLSSTASRVGK